MASSIRKKHPPVLTLTKKKRIKSRCESRTTPIDLPEAEAGVSEAA
jgi:hypothetical protein